MTSSADTLLVRAATVQDMAQVQSIYEHHVLHGTGSFEEEPPDLAEMVERFEAVGRLGMPYLAAESRGRVVGYAYASPYLSRSAYRFTVQDSVYIHRDHAGQGIGRALMADLIRRCRERGFRQMVAIIGGSDNKGSIRLHAGLGFRTVGTLQAVGCKFDLWCDTVLMQLPL